MRLAVAVDHRRRAMGRPEAGLARPVGLDDVRHDHEQRVGVRRLRGEQRLSRLAQARLVGEQEGPVAGRGSGDEPRLVRHQLHPGRRAPRGRRGQRHARRVPATGALERVEEGAEQLPAGQATRPGGGLRRGREVGGQEGIGQLPGEHRLREDRALGRRGRGRGLRRRGHLDRGLDTGVPQHVPRQRAGRVGHDGVLGEQRQQARVPDGARRQDRRDALQPLQLLGPTALAAGRRPDAGALLAEQQGDGLELRPHRRRHATALHGRLDLTDGPGEHRDDVAAAAAPSLVPRGGSARVPLTWSSHELLLLDATDVAAAACGTTPRTGRTADRPRAPDAAPARGYPGSAPLPRTWHRRGGWWMRTIVVAGRPPGTRGRYLALAQRVRGSAIPRLGPLDRSVTHASGLPDDMPHGSAPRGNSSITSTGRPSARRWRTTSPATSVACPARVRSTSGAAVREAQRGQRAGAASRTRRRPRARPRRRPGTPS